MGNIFAECWLELGEEWGVKLSSELKERVMAEASKARKPEYCKACGQVLPIIQVKI